MDAQWVSRQRQQQQISNRQRSGEDGEAEALLLPAGCPPSPRRALLSLLASFPSSGRGYCLHGLPAGEERVFSQLRWTLAACGFHRCAGVESVDCVLCFARSPPPQRRLTGLGRAELRVLHFPFFTQLSHKHRLSASVERQRRETGCAHLFPHVPASFRLPQQAADWLREHERRGGRVLPELRAAVLGLTDRQAAARRRAQLLKQRRGSGDECGDREAELSEQEEEAAGAETRDDPLAASSAHFYSSHTDVSVCPPAFAAASAAPVWIVKPAHLGSGRGICVTDLSAAGSGELQRVLASHDECVAQSYVLQPALLDQRKMDLRLYVALLSPFAPQLSSACPRTAAAWPRFPFAVWLYEDGLVRVAAEPYSAQCSRLSERFLHLTNNAVARQRSQAEGAARNTTLLQWMQRAGLSEDERETLQRDIERAVLSAVSSSSAFLRSGSRRRFVSRFELLGFDLLLDSQRHVWLCELNSLPDLRCSASPFSPPFPADAAVKPPLIADLLTLLCFSNEQPEPPSEQRQRWRPHHVGGFRRLV